MDQKNWKIHNPSGKMRVIVTKDLLGSRWLEILIEADCRVEVCTSNDVLSVDEIKEAIGRKCDGVLGQVTEDWNHELFASLRSAGGMVYSNVAVGFNNVDVDAATKQKIPVGNTPGVLTETTAEMAVTLTFAAARRIGEAERFLRAGKYKEGMMNLFFGKRLFRKTLGVIGAGRIGVTYAKMMVEGHKMNLIYYDICQNKDLEDYIAAYGDFLKLRGEEPVSCKQAATIEDLMREADCVSLHTVLDESTHHLINAERLLLMKKNAILVNTSRGPVIDEAALVAHCQKFPNFRAGLDVFEDEPRLKPGLKALDNVVIVPHIASANRWTREGMATLAAINVTAVLSGYPAWNKTDILPFLEQETPEAAPSIVNAKELVYPMIEDL
jgi:hydroxypyruvate reductase 1